MGHCNNSETPGHSKQPSKHTNQPGEQPERDFKSYQQDARFQRWRI